MPKLIVGACLLFAIGCSTYKQTQGNDPRIYLEEQAEMAVTDLKRRDSTLQKFFDGAAGYAVSPEVAKGAAGIGAAHSEGVVYANGAAIGYSELTQITLGAQLGGQVYSELLFFETDHELAAFKAGDVEFSAQASAVAAAEGAGANADHSHGIAIFTAGE